MPVGGAPAAALIIISFVHLRARLAGNYAATSSEQSGSQHGVPGPAGTPSAVEAVVATTHRAARAERSVEGRQIARGAGCARTPRPNLSPIVTLTLHDTASARLITMFLSLLNGQVVQNFVIKLKRHRGSHAITVSESAIVDVTRAATGRS